MVTRALSQQPRPTHTLGFPIILSLFFDDAGTNRYTGVRASEGLMSPLCDVHWAVPSAQSPVKVRPNSTYWASRPSPTTGSSPCRVGVVPGASPRLSEPSLGVPACVPACNDAGANDLFGSTWVLQ